jgi:apolipoprotein N-acyltransferase
VDLLVNMTNDGWYSGTVEVCSTYRSRRCGAWRTACPWPAA